jgi:hypothetical protein
MLARRLHDTPCGSSYNGNVSFIFPMVEPVNTVDSVAGRHLRPLMRGSESGVYQVIPVWLKFDQWNNILCCLSFYMAEQSGKTGKRQGVCIGDSPLSRRFNKGKT